MTLPPDSRRLVLGVAREAIASRLQGRPCDLPAVEGEAWTRLAAVFVSLHLRRSGDLRGCIGTTTPRQPLLGAVVDSARAAAFEDPRFPPVADRELGDLRIEVSILSEATPVRPEAVEPGVHGVVVRHHGRSGLFLPQVAPEQGWDLRALLDHTCAKAGLPRDAWQDPACRVEVFTTEVFGE